MQYAILHYREMYDLDEDATVPTPEIVGPFPHAGEAGWYAQEASEIGGGAIVIPFYEPGEDRE